MNRQLIYPQLLRLLWAFGAGAAAGLLYDFLRGFRYGRGEGWEIFSDAILFAFLGAGLFILSMTDSEGRLGLWEGISVICGLGAYFYALSRYIFPIIWRLRKASAFFFERNKNFIKKIVVYTKNVFKKTQE